MAIAHPWSLKSDLSQGKIGSRVINCMYGITYSKSGHNSELQSKEKEPSLKACQ